jgi:hypothetical protein
MTRKNKTSIVKAPAGGGGGHGTSQEMSETRWTVNTFISPNRNIITNVKFKAILWYPLAVGTLCKALFLTHVTSLLLLLRFYGDHNPGPKRFVMRRRGGIPHFSAHIYQLPPVPTPDL